MWRWSLNGICENRTHDVFSTYVEVILQVQQMNYPKMSILHVCGGDPDRYELFEACKEYSPRMWRWSSTIDVSDTNIVVFSTYVEVILLLAHRQGINCSILHVCGGDPFVWICHKILLKYSPRMWRWSWHPRLNQTPSRVFSTYVEVILWPFNFQWIAICILHVCGGDPQVIIEESCRKRYSPRMWRWSWCITIVRIVSLVFSTYVEVIPWDLISFSVWVCILHVCGGDPNFWHFYNPFERYSPRMWRWSCYQLE